MAKKISVIIPNYNGRHLLAKHLPRVIKNCPASEIIIIDDASTDDSAKFLKTNFKNRIKLLINHKNLGFARSVNLGVHNASADLVLLLNSDISPRAGFLKPLLDRFENKNKKNLFAVGSAQFSHYQDLIQISGRGEGRFEKGFVRHFAAKPVPGKTLWVSGGAGLFEKEKFLELGGFDPSFAPYYWEDIDLCFRAWIRGFECLFEPKSKVDHFHLEGAIKNYFSDFKIKSVSYKNQFLFVWKNLEDPLWLSQHLLWLPYHLVKSLIGFDLAFPVGLISAILSIPSLVVNYPPDQGQSKFSEKEVVNQFAKP